MDNNLILASYYEADKSQTVVIFPIAWAHEVGGNWYISHIFEV